ncbi:MAG: hypothetical protein CSA26_07665 [Desulfobacterales bacterium]|nr:MAG: hypothetical protein CSA26_07665 [Desulfobacterales bacterium]
MKIGYGARIAGLFFLFTSLLTAGCGYKNDPVPPESVVPKAIEDLRYALDESGVRLTWSYPVKTIKNDELMEISSFDVYRAVISLDDYCADCPIPFGEPVEVPGGITSVEGKERVAEYQTSLLRPRHKYFFKVRSRNSWWADSADSNIVSFVWNIPAQPPTGLTAQAADSRITLNWQPVTKLIDNRDIDGSISYQVMRSTGGKEFEVTGNPVNQTRFVDSLVVNGQNYFYKVQSLLDFKGHMIAGGVSDVVTASPIDQTPPPIPSGVKAVQSGTDIKVFWDPSGDTEVAGYRVYRRMATEKKAQLVAEVMIPVTLFVDKNVPKDVKVYYSVTAFDQMQPANESEPSREATIR